MNLQQLRYVKALADEGSFVAAASRCAVTQPTLSNSIAQLEAEIGHRIFRRTTRRVALTPVGERLLPAIAATLKAFDNVRELARQIGAGGVALHVGISPLVGIRQAEDFLGSFRAKRPEVGVIYHEGNLDELLVLMKHAQIDLVLSPLDAGATSSLDCASRHLLSEPLMFMPRKEVAEQWRHVVGVSVSEIADEQFVLVSAACGLTQATKKIFDVCRRQLIRYPGEASSCATIVEWVQRGLGSGILPASKVPSDAERLRRIPIVLNDRPAQIDYYALGHPNTVPADLFDELWGTLADAARGREMKPNRAMAG